ncbi:MOSC domain-containing protein [bacterium]|nr:MOSC domain-containing protein [bacterium]
MEAAGNVEGLFVASAAGEPMRACASVQLVPGVGIPNDRYAAGQGHWSDPRWPDQQVTLVEAELCESLWLPLDALRRNIVTRGAVLELLIGVQFRIGSALLRGVRPCDPCRYIETLTRDGLFLDLAGRGGLRAAVIAPGDVALGDAIHISPVATQP